LPITRYIQIPVRFYDEGEGEISAYAPISDGQSLLVGGGWSLDEAVEILQMNATSKFRHWIQPE
jgi:hypothetical protein